LDTPPPLRCKVPSGSKTSEPNPSVPQEKFRRYNEPWNHLWPRPRKSFGLIVFRHSSGKSFRPTQAGRNCPEKSDPSFQSLTIFPIFFFPPLFFFFNLFPGGLFQVLFLPFFPFFSPPTLPSWQTLFFNSSSPFQVPPFLEARIEPLPGQHVLF